MTFNEDSRGDDLSLPRPLAGEDRGEGPIVDAPSPLPSPPRRRGGEGIVLGGFEMMSLRLIDLWV